MTVAELIPKMSDEEWAKCRQVLRLCVASLMVADDVRIIHNILCF